MSTAVEEGQKLAAAAYATAPITPQNLGPVINGLVYFFSIVCLAITCLRAWVRFGGEQRWGWDDVLAVGAFVAFVPSNVFGVLATFYGLGARDEYVTDLLEMRAIEYFMYYEILYFAASSTTKISITLTVLRLSDKQKIYRRIAIGNAVMMMVAAGAAGAFVLSNCRPLQVYWNPNMGTCTYGEPGLGALEVVSLVGSTFQMLSDWVSALLPFFIIKNLVMAKRTKIGLICILGLGIMASIAALARMLFYKYWNKDEYPTGYLYHTGVIVITSELEVGLGMIACSLPPLRKLLKTFVSTTRSRMGLSSGGVGTGQDGSNYHFQTSTSGMKRLGPRRGSTELTSMSTPGPVLGKSEWSRLDDESLKEERSGGLQGSGPKSPRGVIIKETTVEIQRTHMDPSLDSPRMF